MVKHESQIGMRLDGQREEKRVLGRHLPCLDRDTTAKARRRQQRPQFVSQEVTAQCAQVLGDPIVFNGVVRHQVHVGVDPTRRRIGQWTLSASTVAGTMPARSPARPSMLDDRFWSANPG
jgi:hypothetical protein